MEADGLVARRTDPRDRRASLITTTRAGRARWRRAHDVYRAYLDARLGPHLRDVDTAALVAVLERIGTGLSAGRPP
jgi:DNA-binding MarR family transcriptional regulator